MQLLSLVVLSPEAQRLQEELSQKLAHNYTGEIIVFAAITFALWVAAAWVAAIAVVGNRGGLGSALIIGLRWFTGFLGAIALAGAAFYFARLRGSGPMATASIGIGALLLLCTAVGAPVKIFKISYVKGSVFALIGVIVHLAAQVAVQKAMNDPLMLTTRFDQVRSLAALPAAEAAQVLAAVKKPAKPATVAAVAPKPVVPAIPAATAAPGTQPKPRVKTVAERHDDLKRMYADLMAKRESLKEGDDEALAAYTRDTAQYVEKLVQLQKDADAEKK